MSPTGKSYSFRSYVRAKLCVPARDDVAPIAGGSDVRKSSGLCGCVCGLPFPLGRNVKVIEKLL